MTLENTPSLLIPPPIGPLGRWLIPSREETEDGKIVAAARWNHMRCGPRFVGVVKVGIKPLEFPISFGSAVAEGSGGEPGGG